MASIFDTDIMLGDGLQIVKGADGDFALVNDFDCLKQDIICEALTQEGELFYEEDYGWSLLDFIQSEYDELTKAEIVQRVTNKLGQRDEIAKETISVKLVIEDNKLGINARFKLLDIEVILNLLLSDDSVEVVNDNDG